MDQDFDNLVDMARNVLNRGSHNFDAGNREGDRYAAFALVCLSEAARSGPWPCSCSVTPWGR